MHKRLLLLVGIILLTGCTSPPPQPPATREPTGQQTAQWTPTAGKVTPVEVQGWIRLKIAQWNLIPDETTPDAVYRYQLNGQTVYYFRAACCDKFNQVFDAEGQLICAPDGGFTGRGDGKCPNFKKTATGGEMVWEAAHR